MDVRQWLSRFRKRSPLAGSPESASLSFKEMEGHLNHAALSLFERYRPELLDRTSLYLVPAVWGEQGSGELDSVQEEIHRTVAPLIEELLARLTQGRSGPEEAEGLEYLLKGLFLYKMAYMVQYYLNCRVRLENLPGDAEHRLERLEPAGRA